MVPLRDRTLRNTSASTVSAVFLACAVGFAPVSSALATPTKVALLRFELSNLEEEDDILRKDLLGKIVARLERADVRTQVIDPLIARRFARGERLERYLERINARFSVDGEFQGYEDEDKVRITVNLRDRSPKPGLQSVETWKNTLSKDLEQLNYWFDAVAEKIHDRVHDKEDKDDVFTYCFEPEDAVAQPDDKFRLALPKQLRDTLDDKGFGNYYILQTFNDKFQVRQECDDPMNAKREHLYVHSYVIHGEIAAKGSSDIPELTVSIKVQVNNLDVRQRDEEPMVSFSAQQDGQFVEQLAAHILKEWNKRIEPLDR